MAIDLSTSGVAAARRVSAGARARGLRYLDAPVAEATVNAWRMAVAQGLGDEDITTIARMYERWAGVEIREKG